MPAQRSHEPKVFLSSSSCSFQVGASSHSFAVVYAAKKDLKLEDLSVSKGNIIVPGLAILEFIPHPLPRKVLHCCRCHATMQRYVDTTMSWWHDKTQRHNKTRRHDKTRRCENTTTRRRCCQCPCALTSSYNLQIYLNYERGLKPFEFGGACSGSGRPRLAQWIYSKQVLLRIINELLGVCILSNWYQALVPGTTRKSNSEFGVYSLA